MEQIIAAYLDADYLEWLVSNVFLFAIGAGCQFLVWLIGYTIKWCFGFFWRAS